MDRLLIIDWGITIIVISDRNPKKNSDIWQMFFERMETKKFIFTVYHAQTDKISERTNQTMEIIIRFFTTNYPNTNFVLIFPFLQRQFNNSFNAITGLSANKFNYGFKVRETFSNFTEPKTYDLFTQRLEYRPKTVDVSAFANVKTKFYYDLRHIPLLLNAGDQIYLKFLHGYKFRGRFNKRVSQQRCGPFKIVKRIKRIIY